MRTLPRVDGVCLRGAHEHRGRVGAAVLGRRVLVEAVGGLGLECVVSAPPLLQVAVEAHPGSVQVEVAHVAGAVVAERVHDIRGDERERAGAEHAVAVVEGERERAFEHVEAVRVQPVHVRVGPTLAGGVARLREHDVLEGEPDAHRPPGRDDDRLTTGSSMTRRSGSAAVVGLRVMAGGRLAGREPQRAETQ